MLDHDLAYLIFDHLIRRTACPDCGAASGLPCQTISGGRIGTDCAYYHQGRTSQARYLDRQITVVFESQTCERCGMNLKFHHGFGEPQIHFCKQSEDKRGPRPESIPPKFLEAIARGKATLEEGIVEPPDRLSVLESRLGRIEASLAQLAAPRDPPEPPPVTR